MNVAMSQQALQREDEEFVANPTIDSLPLGAHLTTPRRGYVHHGIYVGGGRVVHYRRFNRLFRKGPVEEISLDQFTRGRGIAVKIELAPNFSGVERVKRARSRIGEDRYRFWSNNCEHFCEWCISGIQRSAQVEAWRARIDRWRAAAGVLHERGRGRQSVRCS